MRPRIVTMVLTLGCAGAVVGQTAPGTSPASPPRRPPIDRSVAAPKDPAVIPATPESEAPAGSPAAPPDGAASTDTQVLKSGAVAPAPASLDELGRPAIPLPTGPVEPFLLTRTNGPFMVLAHTFHGPDSVRYAQALAMELRQKYQLPAYVFFLRIQPGRSNIRNVPPTAPPEIMSDEGLKGPERYREYDEACVLVGDCKTIDDSQHLLHKVKKLHPEAVDGLPSIWKIRKGKGLSRAMLTTNPLVGSQELFQAQGGGKHHKDPDQILRPGQAVDPGMLTASFQQHKKADPLVKRMNSGPRSFYNCPGPYSLQVAEFLGRSATDEKDPRFQNDTFLRQGPLAKAADDAENLASSLTKCRSLDKQFQPYVYHDRTSSRVFLGSFQGPNDPALAQLRGQLDKVSNELVLHKYTMLPLAPAAKLTAVERP